MLYGVGSSKIFTLHLYSINKAMLSVWYILILNIYAMKFTQCVRLKNMNLNKESLRVIEGRDALPGEYPYVLGVEIEIKTITSTVNILLCTCAYIKPTWGLTAGHCIRDMKSVTLREVEKFVVRYEPSHTEVVFVKILSMFLAPNFHSSSRPFFMYHDIGIFKTEKIALSSYARVSSIDYSTLYGLKVSAVGYGLMLDGQGSFNDTLSLKKTLQVVDAMIVKCNFNIFPNYCLAGICEKWTSLANGDSGGPIIHSSGVVGLITGGNKLTLKRELFNNKSIIGAITPVSPFMDWIVNVINENV